MMKFCTNCGSQLAPEQRFCTKCGAPQAVAEAPAPIAAPAPVVEVAPEPIPEPTPEPEPIPEPAPAPTPAAPEYPNALQVILKLGKAGVVDDVLDEPEGLAGPAQSAWAHDQLAAITHKWGGAEFKVVFADGNLDVTSYSSLTNHEPGTTSMRYGNWIVYVTPSTGQANESAAVLEKLFSLLG
jgi:hypothetical protein